MNNFTKWALFSGIFLILFIPLWFVLQTEDDSPQYAENLHNLNNRQDHNTFESQVSERSMKRILAEDLAKTTQLFMDQLEFQLKRWSSYDFSRAEMKERFEEEVKEHPHFNGFALVRDGKVMIQSGELDVARLKEHLSHAAGKSKMTTDPYVRDDKSYMLYGKKEGDTWVFGEIDLSFVKGFVGAMAEVADANGNMFISAENQEVKWSSEDIQNRRLVTQKVDELDWTIILQEAPDEEEEELHYVEQEAIVKLNEEIVIQEWLLHHPQIQVIKEQAPYYTLRHESISTQDFIRLLEREEAVQYVEPHYIYNKQGELNFDLERSIHTKNENYGDATAAEPVRPNDEFYRPYQWNLSQIHAEIAWEITGGTEEVIIAVLDTGVDPNHQDLAGKLTHGYNAFDRSSHFADDHGHGTHVAGITGAITNNVTGIAGVTWYNPIMPVKVLDGDGQGGIFEIAEGIRWATDQGAGVINLSLGDTEHSMMLYEAIRYAYEHDVVLIAAAGNDNVGQPMYPAGYPEVLSVSAVDEFQQKAIFSNYGEHMDVAAPGEHIPSTFPDNQYVFMSGTSMASPHVAGVAGLIRSVNPNLNNEQVYAILRETSEDLGPRGHDPYYGHGEINVANALQYILNQEENTLHMDEETHNMDGEWFSGLLRIFEWFR